jgi:Asp-tRNA(Asn)/Glu-tRNA(Gln) amidotransferase A subunit family amidase
VDGSSSKKIPVGMQIMGRRFDEMSILRAAKAWEVPGSVGYLGRAVFRQKEDIEHYG